MSNGCEQETEGFGCVGLDTVQWVNDTARKLADESSSSSPSPVQSLMYVHIPVPEFNQLWDSRPSHSRKSSSSSSSSEIKGRKEEDVSCPLLNTGLFKVAKEAGINALYSGHDHNNDYVGVLDGVRLGFGRKTGCGSYGPPEGWKHGARVVELRIGNNDPAYSDQWIRQEDGSVLFQSSARRRRWKEGFTWTVLCRLVRHMGVVSLCVVGVMLISRKEGVVEWWRWSCYGEPGYRAVGREVEKSGSGGVVRS